MNICIPSKPSHVATVIPIYLEPVMGSGERLTVLIGGIAEDGNLNKDVRQVMRFRILECLYGTEPAKGIQNHIEIVMGDLLRYIVNAKDFSEWNPPLVGMFKGTERKEAGDSWDDIFKHATMLYSSLASPYEEGF